jgi:hypothetical protein
VQNNQKSKIKNQKFLLSLRRPPLLNPDRPRFRRLWIHAGRHLVAALVGANRLLPRRPGPRRRLLELEAL